MSSNRKQSVKEQMAENFFELYRKQSTDPILRILQGMGTQGTTENEFYSIMKNTKMYLNEFYRIREMLIKHGLISYRLNKELQKDIFLTQKGFELIKMLDEIYAMFDEEKIN